MRTGNKNITIILLLILLIILSAVIVSYFLMASSGNQPKPSTGIFVDMPIVWSFSTSEDIVSSPVNDGRNTYIRTAKSIIALDGNSGKVIWKHPSHTSGPLALHPYISDSYLIFPETDSSLTILNIVTGQLVWHSKSPQSNFTSPENLPVESIAFVEDVVLAARLNWKLTAYELKSGLILWEYDLPNRTNPYITTSNSTVFLGVGDQLVALYSKTGKVIWKVELPGFAGNIFFDTSISKLIVGDVDGPKLLFVNPENGNIIKESPLNIASEFGINCIFGDSKGILVAADGLSSVSQITGVEKWHVNNVGHLECPTILDNLLFVRNTNTTLFAYNTKTGIDLGEMYVEENTPLAHEPDRSPIAMNNLLLIPINNNELIAYRP